MFVPQFECGIHTMLLLAQAYATEDQSSLLSNAWLSGFIEADGHFVETRRRGSVMGGTARRAAKLQLPCFG